jgi:hypothetical protein
MRCKFALHKLQKQSVFILCGASCLSGRHQLSLASRPICRSRGPPLLRGRLGDFYQRRTLLPLCAVQDNRVDERMGWMLDRCYQNLFSRRLNLVGCVALKQQSCALFLLAEKGACNPTKKKFSK